MIKRPKLFLVGGPNGAGKAPFAHTFLAEHPDYVFLNADEIARQLQPENVHEARFGAGRTFLTELAALRAAQANLVVESTLSGVSLAQHIRLFAAAGYYISLVFVFVPSVQLSINRVASRVLAGGHHIPTEDLVRRFKRSKRNFWRTYRLLADEWQLILNADAGFVYVADFANHGLTVQAESVFADFVEEQGPDLVRTA